jgi:hypothetical protein
MMTKLRIKIGDFEIDAEGEEQFVKNDLLEIVKSAMKLQDTTVVRTRDFAGGAEGGEDDRHSRHNVVQLTTSSIAAKLNAKSGPDLIIAAAAQLTFVQNKESFGRNELLKQARTASAYFNENVRKNLSSHLNSLVRARKLNELSVGVFAIHAAARAELETIIGS